MSKQQLLEKAGAQIGTLAEGAGIRPIAMAIDLAGVGSEMLPSLLAHELVAGHAAMMRLTAKLDHFLAMIAPDRSPEDQDRGCRQAVQLSGAAARLTERYRLGLMSLARLNRWADPARRPARAADPAHEFDDDPFDGGPGSGTRKSPAKMLAEVAALNKSMGAMLNATRPDGAKPNGNGTHLQAPPNRACAPEGASARRRGRLKHGNLSGDFLAAPRCGARTRAGCACRQPAMANGRCRLHGGKSTGARTAAGLARCRTASLVHGHRTAEIIDLKSAAARHGRTIQTLARAARAQSKLQSERPTPCPAMTTRLAPIVGATGRSPVSPPLDPTRVTAISCGRPTGDRPVAPTPLRSERPTPCPATPPAPAQPLRRRSATGGAACHSARRRAMR